MILILLIAALALLSLSQRLVPWLVISRFSGGRNMEQIFNLFAVSAFSALAVYNITEFTAGSLVSLAVAALVALRTRNLGYAVLAAIAVSLVALYILGYPCPGVVPDGIRAQVIMGIPGPQHP